MASAHIEITGTASRLSADVRSAVDQLEALQDKFSDIKAILDQVAMGADWAALATYLGVSAANAEAVYNLWGSATTEINGTFLTQLQARLG
jgi:hypothetical protein